MFTRAKKILASELMYALEKDEEEAELYLDELLSESAADKVGAATSGRRPGEVATALLVAAGRGERLGSDGPKAFVVLGGRPLLEWSLEALRAVPAIGRIVVALPDGVAAPEGTVGVRGGAERSHSVRNALAAADAGDTSSWSTTPPGRS